MDNLIINNTQSLTTYCQHLQTCSWMAIDTEFMRVDTFFAELSLIQVQSSTGQIALIDPLSFDDPSKDLAPFWECLTNAKLIKVFHSARQDIEVLYQVSQKMPVSIFDTQIAGVFLGYGNLSGLTKIILGELNITLEKDQTRTNWSQRPLSEKQLQYAINDVKFLAPLYEKIIYQLSTEQLNALTADFNDLLSPSLYDINLDLAGTKIKNLKGLSPKQIAITDALAYWRESFAVNNNKPRRWVISDDAVIAMAKRPPQSQEALYKVPNIKASSIKLYGQEWINIIDKVFTQPELWPKKPVKTLKPSINEAKLIDISQAFLTQITQDNNCSASHIANKTDLLNVLRQENPVLEGWRYFLYEKPLRELLSGQKSLIIKQENIQLK